MCVRSSVWKCVRGGRCRGRSSLSGLVLGIHLGRAGTLLWWRPRLLGNVLLRFKVDVTDVMRRMTSAVVRVGIRGELLGPARLHSRRRCLHAGCICAAGKPGRCVRVDVKL